MEERRDNNAEEWKLAMARTCKKKRFFPECEVFLQHCSLTLQADEDRALTSGGTPGLRRAAPSAPCVTPVQLTKGRGRWETGVGAPFREVQRSSCADPALCREGWCSCLFVLGTSLRGCQALDSPLLVTQCQELGIYSCQHQ